MSPEKKRINAHCNYNYSTDVLNSWCHCSFFEKRLFFCWHVAISIFTYQRCNDYSHPDIFIDISNRTAYNCNK